MPLLGARIVRCKFLGRLPAVRRPTGFAAGRWRIGRTAGSGMCSGWAQWIIHCLAVRVIYPLGGDGVQAVVDGFASRPRLFRRVGVADDLKLDARFGRIPALPGAAAGLQEHQLRRVPLLAFARANATLRSADRAEPNDDGLDGQQRISGHSTPRSRRPAWNSLRRRSAANRGGALLR